VLLVVDRIYNAPVAAWPCSHLSYTRTSLYYRGVLSEKQSGSSGYERDRRTSHFVGLRHVEWR
jgi:hypothetical protein